MAPKILLTGATGYIGGSVFASIAKKHPEYDMTVLLRKPPPDFQTKFRDVKIVRGDFDNSAVLSKAASEADIVVHCGNSDHENALRAIIDGILSRDHGAFLIHLSGTGILSDFRDTTEYRGRLNPKVWSDIKSIDEITSRPMNALHRSTDTMIQDAADKHGEKFKAAIVCPPDLYGKGLGPGKVESVFFPAFVNEIKRVGAPFYVDEGSNARGWTHIDDLMDIYMALVEAAAAGGGPATWGREGYYFATTQEVNQKAVAEATAKILHEKGVIATVDTKQISAEMIEGTAAARRLPDLGFYLYASNSRTVAERAKKDFGYKPNSPSLWECIEADITRALEQQ